MNIPSKVERPPIIAVLGHIDHGKSTLLDHIRKANVVAGEAGGITQLLSAYEVEHEREGVMKKITFLDTPGHAAFKAMRSRGAGVADIAILVVAADDGVKAQTLEALEAITTANIPYIVAINKIDKPDADINRTITSLIEHGIYIEGYGGDIPYVPLSAKTGEKIDELLDVILLVAELEDLKADQSVPAEGVVIETNIDPKKGTSATLIITNGTLKLGTFIQAGTSISPVRILDDFTGRKIQEASFSAPVRVTGFDTAPAVGSQFQTFSKKKEAERKVIEIRNNESKSTESFENNFETFVIPLVIKTRVSGTQEAIEHEIAKLNTERGKFQIVHRGLGTITENDVRIASSVENTIIIGFDVDVTDSSKLLAERQSVKIEQFNIIYAMTEWLEKLLEEKTPKQEVRDIIGKMKVAKTFSKTRHKQIIGGKVLEGKAVRGKKAIIMRRDEEIGEGEIVGLQQLKVQSDEVFEGNECGCEFESKLEVAPGDVLHIFEMKTV
jgi:translation initiation factor IF-2